MQSSMIATTSILNGINADFGDVEKVLSKYEDTLSRGSVDLYDSLQMAQELENKLTQIIADFTTLRQDEQYKQFMEILETDPQQLGNFISSPVNLDTVGIYEIENYGSAMAPFYTILALWVGALILVAIIHVKVEPEDGITDIKPWRSVLCADTVPQSIPILACRSSQQFCVYAVYLFTYRRIWECR